MNKIAKVQLTVKYEILKENLEDANLAIAFPSILCLEDIKIEIGSKKLKVEVVGNSPTKIKSFE